MIPQRKIIHVDMDAFYASVEQRDRPELRGKPIAVGMNSDRGVITTASYEARIFGVGSAMSSKVAKRRCPDLIFVPPNFEKYRQVSRQIRRIFYEYTDLVEPLSLDEAYLDVTQNKKGNPSATLIARQIRQEISDKTGLTASAGISINKFLAKIASDIDKPNGQTTITPEEINDFIEGLEIYKFHGVGKVTTQKMYSLGIFTGEDLKTKSLAFLKEHFGKPGEHYYDMARGVDLSPVQPHRIPKSLSAEHTFSENISSEIFMFERLKEIADSVEQRLAKNNLKGKTLTLKIKYSDFSIQTRSKTVDKFISTKGTILALAKGLLYQDKMKDSVRLLGLSVSNFNTAKEKDQKEVYVQLQFDF
ncbi:MAG TPA: DNA polymerase IV [Flavobacteriaceae bacterium]|nr:DNA polymerase IV [Flavobacteriaceae bacterium]